MSIPSFFNMYQALIARPSISSLDPSLNLHQVFLDFPVRFLNDVQSTVET